MKCSKNAFAASVPFGTGMGSRGELFHVSKLVAEKKLWPVVDRVLPLAEARAAHEVMEKREQFGKVVLQV